MTNESEHEIAEIGVRLLDDAYTAWRAAAMDAGAALRAWLEGSSRNRDIGWFAYLAALDREEAAAHDLERLSQLTHPCVAQITSPMIGESTAHPTA
jgi:hypothetical protein